MKNNAKQLSRAAIIAALYVLLSCIFLPFAYGPIQVRPAEALCLLPLFYAEGVPALFLGCLIVNLIGGSFDFFIGACITLLAAVLTRLVGKFLKNNAARICLGGLFPVLLNAALLPLVFLFFAGTSQGAPSWITYFSYFGSLLLTQTLWVYGLGAPLYGFIAKMRNKGAPFLL